MDSLPFLARLFGFGFFKFISLCLSHSDSFPFYNSSFVLSVFLLDFDFFLNHVLFSLSQYSRSNLFVFFSYFTLTLSLKVGLFLVFIHLSCMLYPRLTCSTPCLVSLYCSYLLSSKFNSFSVSRFLSLTVSYHDHFQFIKSPVR